MRPQPIGAQAVADGALSAFRRLCEVEVCADVSGRALLSDRNIGAPGVRSANQTCELFASLDGFTAFNFARDEDVASIPALLEDDPSTFAGRLARDDGTLVARGRMMGLPISRLGDVSAPDFAWVLRARDVGEKHRRRVRDAVVVDLSSLWAGPLASSLLAQTGARVIKVESIPRPDPSRDATPAFFDLMNAGKESVALDFRTREGQRALAGLLRSADIVIEASRPRALEQLGLHPERFRRPGQTWVSITGYGRDDPECHWVAFGDDAAVAGGLIEVGPTPRFLGDAIADPLTGLHAACAAVTRYHAGGGHIDIALARVAAFVRRFHDPASGPIERRVARIAEHSAAPFGGDTKTVLEEFRCN